MGKRYHDVADNRYNRRRYRHRRPQARASRWWMTVLIAAGLVGGALAIQIGPEYTSCNIKGNISYYGGQHIYHVPGQEYYSATRINLLKGERWFCSEAEARAAGWRRAKR